MKSCVSLWTVFLPRCRSCSSFTLWCVATAKRFSLPDTVSFVNVLYSCSYSSGAEVVSRVFYNKRQCGGFPVCVPCYTVWSFFGAMSLMGWLGCGRCTTPTVLANARLFPEMATVFIFAKEPVFGFVGPLCGVCVVFHHFLALMIHVHAH